jgi:hypothetical protein
LLSIPGGLTIEQYHRAIDDRAMIHQFKPQNRMFFGPIYIASTLFGDNHQLLPSIVKAIDEIVLDPMTSAPSQLNSNDLIVQELPHKLLSSSRLGELYQTEPMSLGRPGVAENPHM